MWFQLNTTFSTHLGALSTLQSNYGVTYSLSNFTKTTAPDMVEKDKSLTVVLTMVEGATFTTASMTDGTNTVTGSLSGSTVTMTISSVKGPVTVIARATGANGDDGEEDEPINPTPGGTVITYTSRQSSSGISKSTGEYLSSSTGYVNIYENIDPTKTYAVTSYAPSNTSDNACVCYYTADGTFISAESGSDWGISSVEYTMQELTIPSNASTIKLFGRSNNQEAVLYLTSTISLSEISYSSQSTSSNLNETNGALGTSSTGYVNVYDNIDASKTYYASGFCPNASGTAAFVCYYTSDGTFISAQDGNDFGASSENVVKQKLTVPSTTSTIKVFAQSGQTAAALYVEA